MTDNTPHDAASGLHKHSEAQKTVMTTGFLAACMVIADRSPQHRASVRSLLLQRYKMSQTSVDLLLESLNDFVQAVEAVIASTAANGEN